ncbi:unnamed protein product [Orchesella dallaii]|uniref:Odorant receptor n=1 Tax=Orchesella dallaii TaxID=48710 RepID=A0ABP1R9J5_9HEXA
MFGSIAFLLIREIFKASSCLTPIHISILFCIAVFTLLSWGIFLAFQEHWDEIVSAFNQLAEFEEDWVMMGRQETYRASKPHYFRIWKCSKEELTGVFLMMVIIAVSLIIIPIGSLAGVATNLDLYLIMLEDYFLPPKNEQSKFLIIFLFLCRLIFSFICGTEGCRFMLLVLLVTFSMGLVMEKLLINILEAEDLNEAYQKYQLVWLQYYKVKSPFNNVLAISAFVGFVGGTALIWLSFNAWSYVTPYLAVLYPFLSMWLLIILLVGISSQVSIVEMSKCFIHKWKTDSLLQPGIRMRKNIRHSKMLGRTLRSLPLACGSCYGINSNTPFSFLQILMKAVTDSLLGIQIS